MNITNIARTQTFKGDKSMFVPIEELYQLMFRDIDDIPPYWYKIKLNESADLSNARDIILSHYRDFAATELGLSENKIYAARAFDTRQQTEMFLAEIHKQLNVLLLVFGVICSASVLLIFCIFYMIIFSRIKDIAIIKSCGANSFSIISLFSGFSIAIGLIGSAIGILIGLLVTANLDKIEYAVRIIFGIKLWRASSYQFYNIPTRMDYSSIWWITTAAVIGCLIGALIPAIKAARTRPVKILRYE